jgi:4a-hydroxytetrahydrobiopterin dehydratase
MGLTSTERLTQEQIVEEIRGIPGWSYRADHERIERTFVRKNFLDAAAFIQQIANVAEAHDHHPDILLSGYKNVLVMLSTHSAKGITHKDFEMARAIDTISE